MRNPNYEGSVNYLRIIIENGKIATEIPEVPEARYEELFCAATEQLKLYERPLTGPHCRRPTIPGRCIALGVRHYRRSPRRPEMGIQWNYLCPPRVGQDLGPFLA